MNKALVIFSGGQDSTTALAWAKSRYREVHAINFEYGARHKVERTQAVKIASLWHVPLKLVDLDFLPQLVTSALLDPAASVAATKPSGLPSTFTPNRNQLFIALAHAYAQSIDAETLVAGVCQTDFSGYPDCRDIFIKAIEVATNLGSEKYIQIKTPLMWLTKAETFLMAERLGVLAEIVEYSHTCYLGDREHRHDWGFGCGECPACLLRKGGWEQYGELKSFSAALKLANQKIDLQ